MRAIVAVTSLALAAGFAGPAASAAEPTAHVTTLTQEVTIASAPRSAQDGDVSDTGNQLVIEARESHGDGPSESGSSDTKPAKGGPAKCVDKGNGNAEVPCTDGRGGWWGGTCYLHQVPEAQRPDGDDPIWQGNYPDGSIYGCSQCVLGSVPVDVELLPDQCRTEYTNLIWLAVPPGPEGVDVEALAERAVERMGLAPIGIGIVPDDEPGKIGAVGLPVWLWVDQPAPNTFGPISESASTSNVTVTATARVTSTDWDLGDGTVITCDGPGTPYEDRFGIAPSPDCGHTYDKQGDPYTVTATTHWLVEWEGAGRTGTIETTRTAETQITVGEYQVLNRNG
jgi:hypothetical protein